MPRINLDKCLLCGSCSAVCQANAILIYPHTIEINNSICKNCENCIKICPMGAILK